MIITSFLQHYYMIVTSLLHSPFLHHYYNIITHFLLFLIIKKSLLRIITSLLHYYYIVITPLLFHYYKWEIM